MKKLKTICALLLIVALFSFNALAMEVPTESIVQNLNGEQQYIKVYTVSPETDPASLIEEPFDFGGYTYTYSDITKRENLFSDTKEKTEVVTVTTGKKDLETVLEALSPSMEFDDGRYSGTLNLDHTTIQTEAAGYETRSYTVSDTKELGNLDSNDMSYVPSTTVKDGVTIPLSSVDWQVQSMVLVGDLLVPATYKAVAYYSGKAYYSAATEYISTAEYKGTVSCSEVKDITYTVTYVGTPIAAPIDSESETGDGLEAEPQTDRTLTRIADRSADFGSRTILFVIGGVLLFALVTGGVSIALNSMKKKRERARYEEGSSDEYEDE